MSRRASIVLAVATLCAGGCDWVDSTGVQSGDARTDAPPVALGEVALGDAIELNEGTTARIRTPAATVPTGIVAGEETAPVSWRWEEAPLTEGGLESCDAFDGFDVDRAPDTLAGACTSADDCTFSFVPVADGAGDGDAGDGDAGDGDAGDGEAGDGEAGASGTADDGSVAFELGVPALRAPIGTRRALVESAPDGTELSRREIDFCLVAINEAPLAEPDAYALPAGGTLDVDAADGVLANDVDDDDTSNAPLSVNEVPSRAPANAASFELRADGGFTYEPADPAGQGAGGGADGGADVADSFEYEVSDGLQSSFATVTIDPAAAPVGPVAVDGAPDLVARVGTFVFVDLSVRFTAPAGVPLTFAFAEPLPVDGTLGLTPDGTLSGVAGPGDAGTYELTLVASDGTNVAVSPLVLIVEPAAAAAVPAPSVPVAAPPVAAPVTPPVAVPVTPPVAAPVMPPVAAPVTPPVAVPVAPTVTAPVTPPVAVPLPVDDPVALPGPVFVPGSTFDQALRLGSDVLPVTPTFDAPAGTTLAYASAGDPLPRGVVVDADTGTVAGRPSRRGTYDGLVVEAVDEEGGSAVSDAFAIVVR